MKYFSLFSGIGGFELGIQYSHPDWECVGYSEIDKYAIQVYEKHFKHKNYGDITAINTGELPDFDLLVGGFPCQSFSIAGKRGGFNDTRGTLFFEIARILRDKRPRYFVLENVKGLLSHDGGKTLQTIFGVLTDLGYEFEWQVLNSKNFGVPQNRERIFIVGHIRGGRRPEVFPIRREAEFSSGKTYSNTIDTNYFKGIDNHGQRTMIGTLRTHKSGNGFREIKAGVSPTFPARAREDGSGQPVVKIPVAWSKSHRTGKSDADKRRKNYGQVEERVKIGEFNTLSTGDGGGNQSTKNFVLYPDYQIRRLTPVECERLQGFPDNWTKHGTVESNPGIDETPMSIHLSDTQRYKCLGNAVTVNVIKDIFIKLKT
jgi:DNA (cytosine-5)-methyltransferase 1